MTWKRKCQPTPIFLENSMDRGACGLQAMGSQRVGHNTTERLTLSLILSQWTNIHINLSDATNFDHYLFPPL